MGLKQEFSHYTARIFPASSWKSWENRVCTNIKQGFSQHKPGKNLFWHQSFTSHVYSVCCLPDMHNQTGKAVLFLKPLHMGAVLQKKQNSISCFLSWELKYSVCSSCLDHNALSCCSFTSFLWLWKKLVLTKKLEWENFWDCCSFA